jgi:hypothetical protein
MMKNFTHNQIRQIATEFLDGDQSENFVSLYFASDQQGQNDLLDKLWRINTTQLNEVRQDGDIRIERSNLHSYRAIGKGTKLVFDGNGFFEEESEHSLRWYSQGRDNYSFILEEFKDNAYITVAEVAPQSRGQGYFDQMLRSIFDVCFQSKKFNYVAGRAAPPRTKLFGNTDYRIAGVVESEENDWRTKNQSLRSRKVKIDYPVTKLMNLWMKQKFIYPRSYIDPLADQDQFVILNPSLVATLPRTDLRKLDGCYPKIKANRLALNKQYK